MHHYTRIEGMDACLMVLGLLRPGSLIGIPWYTNTQIMVFVPERMVVVRHASYVNTIRIFTK